ncbi:DUF3397 domain-containing protein [Oceanobacillus sp. CAU 1775]
MMLDIVSKLLAFFITAPLFSSIIVYFISMTIERNKWKAIHRVVNWTTIFYVIAVLMMLQMIFDRNFIGIAIIVLLTILTIIVVVQWKKDRDIQFLSAFKLLLRVSFLLFFVLYGCLMIIGIIIQLVG